MSDQESNEICRGLPVLSTSVSRVHAGRDKRGSHQFLREDRQTERGTVFGDKLTFRG